MINFSVDINVPASGWVANVGVGKKCQHGVYIPETQEDLTFAQHCDICNSLRAYMEKTGFDLETIYQTQRVLWTQLRRDKKEDPEHVEKARLVKQADCIHAPKNEQFKRCDICDAQVVNGECEC